MLEPVVLHAPDAPPFRALHLSHARARCGVLFACGRGGDPARHLPLLEALHASGASVVAPLDEMFPGTRPTEAQLLERVRRLVHARQALLPAALPLHGIGHSIGATLLLALGGAQAWLGPGAALAVPTLPFDTLALLAPALGFFGAPESMGRVQARVSIWWGTEDELCPRTDVERTLAALGDRGALRVAEGAGHFSFMHAPPPGVREPLSDRARFLEALSRDLVRLAGSSA